MLTNDKIMTMCVVFIHLKYILSKNRKNIHGALLSHSSGVLDPNNSEITDLFTVV